MNKIYSEKSIPIIALCDDDVSIIADGTIYCLYLSGYLQLGPK